MIAIMNSLETRIFQKEEIIANEMDECTEILFVCQGRYKVGYEINKERFFKRNFGEATIIGGFNISYQKRFQFLFVANCFMKCQAIRKSKFNRIMKEFPEFKYHLMFKFWTFYS